MAVAVLVRNLRIDAKSHNGLSREHVDSYQVISFMVSEIRDCKVFMKTNGIPEVAKTVIIQKMSDFDLYERF